ncbi:MAG: class I SAM-dependent methyltransferase [Chthoniobacterales bacterium]
MTDWKNFWSSYRKKEVTSEGDLYLEVGKTVGGEPVSEEAYQLSINLITRGLELSQGDLLLELCCGNGLVTRRLAPLVAQIRAVDFSEHLIANAKRFSPAANVSYFCGEAFEHLNGLALSRAFVPTKVLLGDCLCYFEPETLRAMLQAVRGLTANHFVFMASGIPCNELKWNFYNTPERVRRFQENQSLPENTNDGIGRWWGKEELEKIGKALGITAVVREQPSSLSNFRIDAVFADSSKDGAPAAD